MSRLIAVDMGGTQIRAGCYRSEDFSTVQIAKTSTHHKSETVFDRMLNLVAQVWPDEEEVLAVGVAAPGPIDPYAGVQREAPNLTDRKDVPLRRLVEERFHVPVAIGNDANLAAMGEWRFGAGVGHHFVLYLTVSTGIGGGVIMNDQLVLGVNGLATELGHITVIPEGPMCGCGQRGHLEAIASGPALARWVMQEIANGVPSILEGVDPLTAKAVSAAAIDGDPLAAAALARSGAFIGQALADYLHIFNPSIVIIGGGVSLAGKYLLEPMRKAMEEQVMSPYYLENLTLTTAALGDEAGLMGALALAAEHSRNVAQPHF